MSSPHPTELPDAPESDEPETPTAPREVIPPGFMLGRSQPASECRAAEAREEEAAREEEIDPTQSRRGVALEVLIALGRAPARI